MIIRKQFVGNSSSSSFIVNGNDYLTTFDLAEAMIRCREWDSDEDDIKNMRATAHECELDSRINITFKTCNYETYLLWVPDKNRYAIQTCNNHDFYSIHEDDMQASDLELPDIADWGDMEIEVARQGWFWDIDNDIYVKDNSKDWALCSKGDHYSYLMNINHNEDILVCPKCFAEEHPDQTVKAIHAAELVNKVKELTKNKIKKINLRV
jgi:hypothetical protein